MPGWTVGGDIEKISKEAREQFMSYLYLVNGDQEKYGSITRNLNQQYSLGNDQYPKTLVEMNNVLSNHIYNLIKSEN